MGEGRAQLATKATKHPQRSPNQGMAAGAHHFKDRP